MKMRLGSGDMCLADMYPSTIKVWTKYGNTRLYGNGKTNLEIGSGVISYYYIMVFSKNDT